MNKFKSLRAIIQQNLFVECQTCGDVIIALPIVISVIRDGFALGMLQSRDGETFSDGPSWKYGYWL